VDVETGNVIENFDGAFSIPVEDFSNSIENQSILIELNSDLSLV
jgi:hypothetical protein